VSPPHTGQKKIGISSCSISTGQKKIGISSCSISLMRISFPPFFPESPPSFLYFPSIQLSNNLFKQRKQTNQYYHTNAPTTSSHLALIINIKPLFLFLLYYYFFFSFHIFLLFFFLLFQILFLLLLLLYLFSLFLLFLIFTSNFLILINFL